MQREESDRPAGPSARRRGLLYGAAALMVLLSVTLAALVLLRIGTLRIGPAVLAGLATALLVTITQALLRAARR